jgi:type VI secretion system protein ImpF
MPEVRLNPTLFDKLVSRVEMSGLRGAAGSTTKEISRTSLRHYQIPDIERFNESALRTNIRRELAWLLNTTNFESTTDLTDYPQVKYSVVNYGVDDLAGKALSAATIKLRAMKILMAVRAFEPRIAPETLCVEPRDIPERENTLTYVVTGDITSAVNAVAVRYFTDVELDTGAATVRD